MTQKNILLMFETTLKAPCTFSGKGLHTGKISTAKVCPAPSGHGIRFIRTDMEGQPEVEALAAYVSTTSRNTTLTKGNVSLATIEHLMSALAGLGITNARVEIDNVEMPILDGSARPYMEAFAACGIETYPEQKEYVRLSAPVEIRDEQSGSWIRLEPAEEPSIDITVDFGSRVLGVQHAHWDPSVDYAREIGICRTFVFFHEIEYLFANNLIKGGDVDNAIVIVEHPVSPEQLDRMSKLFGRTGLEVVDGGYLNNLQLHFPDECGRHKLLDLIGDLSLCGGFPCAKITAFKPGHKLNTNAAKAVLEQIGK